MKDTGMIRSLDSLGRIVVPAEIRMTRNIDIGDPIEFFVLDEKSSSLGSTPRQSVHFAEATTMSPTIKSSLFVAAV